MEYDGTDFCGYQSQGQGERTVQDVMGQALRVLCPRETIVLHAAGRTDTGVHALGQVLSFQTESAIPLERWAIALNSNLPRDLAIAKVEDAPHDFHARFSARSRTYGYLLWTRRTRSALWGRYSLHVRTALDLQAMRSVAALLVGTHDFAAYARTGEAGQPTVRDLQTLAVRPWTAERILITATATGFLRSMVRNMVGVLLAVGKGELPPSVAQDILDTRDRAQNPCPPAAPQGLFLWHVDY